MLDNRLYVYDPFLECFTYQALFMLSGIVKILPWGFEGLKLCKMNWPEIMSLWFSTLICTIHLSFPRNRLEAPSGCFLGDYHLQRAPPICVYEHGKRGRTLLT